ncbi:hypothetical protein COCNU_scaffold005299G000020 [Cocos nucifera]|nr:hypothetical protein [Cocos nucifera]
MANEGVREVGADRPCMIVLMGRVGATGGGRRSGTVGDGRLREVRGAVVMGRVAGHRWCEAEGRCRGWKAARGRWRRGVAGGGRLQGMGHQGAVVTGWMDDHGWCEMEWHHKGWEAANGRGRRDAVGGGAPKDGGDESGGQPWVV